MSNYFQASESTKKLKSRLIASSGVALFIGLTGKVPEKISLLDWDLSGHQNILGWFVFWVTVYLLIQFIVLAGLDTWKVCVARKIKNQIGEGIGLSVQEIQQSDYLQTHDVEATKIGTISYEIESINKKNEASEDKYNTIHAWTFSFFDIIAPLIFALIGLWYLCQYL